MNGNEVLRIVDAIHRDKNIDKEIVFDGIEASIVSAARKFFGEEAAVEVRIHRDTGEPSVKVDEDDLDAHEIGELLGRIAAQTAKQVMIQKIREAERDALYDEYSSLKSQIVTGTISRMDGGTGTVNLGKVEGILPRGEQIPGESHRVGERIRAVVMEVRKAGSRVKIILSRTHPDLVRRLFELEIPEVAEHVIEVRSIAREAGYRSKVAVSCYDNKVDAVGACVGVRGSRIKTIVDELAGERIDIVRWNDSLQVLVPNALQPAEVEDVILCPMLGKVIVLVMEDQLSLAIGKKGQNVRLASKLVGWDVNLMTQEKLDHQIDESVEAFSHVPHISDELAEDLIAQGFFTFEDLSIIEPDQLAELGGLTEEQVEEIIAFADTESDRIYAHQQRIHEAERLRRRMGLEEPKPEPAKPDEAAVETGEAAAEPEQAAAEAGEAAGSEAVAAAVLDDEPDAAGELEAVASETAELEAADVGEATDLGAGAGLTDEEIDSAADATRTTLAEEPSPDEAAIEEMTTDVIRAETGTEKPAEHEPPDEPPVEAAGLPASADLAGEPVAEEEPVAEDSALDEEKPEAAAAIRGNGAETADASRSSGDRDGEDEQIDRGRAATAEAARTTGAGSEE